MQVVHRTVFILLTTDTKIFQGKTGAEIIWVFRGVFDTKDEAVRVMLTLPLVQEFRAIRTKLPMMYIASDISLNEVDGEVTPLDIDELEDSQPIEVMEVKESAKTIN